MTTISRVVLTQRLSCLASLTMISALALALGLLLASCVTVDSTSVVNYASATSDQPIEPERFLDVGILVFDANVPDDLKAIEKQKILPDVRDTEAIFLPYLLRKTIAKTGQWGVVRVLPRPSDTFEVQVVGKILKSTAKDMILQVQVTDISGSQWFNQTYSGQANSYSYDTSQANRSEPFYGLYLKVAQDMLAYRQKISTERLQELRYIARIKFAQSFSPEAFSGYLEEKDSQSILIRLPSEQEPQYQRIENIRQREHLFVDVLDKRYQEFYNNVYTAYHDWHKFSYAELREEKRLRRQAAASGVLGTIGIIGGITATASNKSSERILGNVGILAGTDIIRAGISFGEQANLHKAALEELGTSFGGAVSEQILEMEDITVMLEGTVEEQYVQLRGVLKNIWLKETAKNDQMLQY